MKKFQLAQINVATIRGENMDDPIMKDFMDQLDSIYKEAETSPGFIWRLEGEADSNSDPKTLINVSVWEDVDALKQFTFNNFHGAILKRRNEWFIKLKAFHTALWWIESGQMPTESEGLERLAYLRQNGPTVEAFGFKDVDFHKPQ